MRNILFVGDFACTTGFATVLQNLALNLQRKWEIDVLAINYNGDPHPLQKRFNIYPADLEGDVHGIKRFPRLVGSGKYDLIFILNDIWIIDMYLQSIKGMPEDRRPPIVFYTPVDARHLKKAFVEPLNQATHALFYTEFGAKEALEGGLKIPYSVIPHGVDMQNFHFMSQKSAREKAGIPSDWYIMLMLDRNQPRKRLDLGIYYFSEWVKRTNKPENVKLYYHGALNDLGIDILDYADYCGVGDRMIITNPNMTLNNMVPLEQLKVIYNMADVFWKPCASEGWGLSLHEAMACKLPALVPKSSALAEWPNGAVHYVDIIPDLPFVNFSQVNTIMDTPSLDSFIEGAEKLYNDPEYRKELGYKAFSRATQARFKWDVIATHFDAVFNQYAKKERK